MYDLVQLERLGVPAAGVATAPFIDEALEQARILGMPDCRMVYVRHPIVLLGHGELHALADEVIDEIVGYLTREPSSAT